MRITIQTGANTPKKITPITTGLTTWCRISPSFIHARFAGASQCARYSVTAAVSAARASSQGWKNATIRKTPENVQPNVRSDGSLRVSFMVLLEGSKIPGLIVGPVGTASVHSDYGLPAM